MIYAASIASTSDTASLPQLQAIEGGARVWDLTLRTSPDVNSAPVDLSDAGDITFLAKTAPSCAAMYIEAPCTVTDPHNGAVRVSLGPGDLTMPGLWWGAVQVKDSAGNVSDEYPCWLLVKRSISSQAGPEPVTVPQVRAFLMDRSPADNKLLAATQFTDDEIIDFMRMPVDEWNDTPPDVARFTTANFPWHSPWLKATAALLLRSLAIRQIRNNATYQGGTVTVNDSDKGPAFMQIGDTLYQEWRQWMLAKKREINIRLGWGDSGLAAFNGGRL